MMPSTAPVGHQGPWPCTCPRCHGTGWILLWDTALDVTGNDAWLPSEYVALAADFVRQLVKPPKYRHPLVWVEVPRQPRPPLPAAHPCFSRHSSWYRARRRERSA